MSQHIKKISKLSTLEAARAIYFIVVALAIRQSLALFSQGPAGDIAAKYQWWEKALVGIGYLVTALRFSHGISMLYGYEKQRIEESILPSPRRVLSISVFLSLLGIIFYLMADNITHTRTFLVLAGLMFITDLAYILRSKVVRKPLLIHKRRKQTIPGTPPRTALQWIISDIILLVVCLVLLILAFLKLHETYQLEETIYMAILGGLLMLAAVMDYSLNRVFYFGGKKDKRRHNIVFVCSPLQGGDESIPIETRMRDNIRRAQWYCNQLMKGSPYNASSMIPFASHSFYTYFLHDNKLTDRIIGQDCAIAYLNACDAIYIYVPFIQDYRLKLFRSKVRLCKNQVPDKSKLSKGMKHEVAEAEKLGLEIRFIRQTEISALPEEWLPVWNPLQFEEPSTDIETHFDPNLIRKRVFVCSYLRGMDFDNLNSEQRWRRLENNISAALWYCHQLVRLPSKDGKEEIAPFAPQAFYPYFWDISDESGGEGDKWSSWFERSIEVLKVCDAVYFYVPDGLPSDKLLSHGMKDIKKLAESIGLEIQYKPTSEPPPNWKPALPEFPSQGDGPDDVGNLDEPAAIEKTRVYFAGPLFTQAEWQWNARLADALEGLGFEILLPQAAAEPMLKKPETFSAGKLFSVNVSSIDSADIVLVVLDQADPDSGTCWEHGYAYKSGKPIVGLRTDIRRTGDDPGASVNLMLSQSCNKFLDVPFDKRDDLDWVAQRTAEMIDRVLGRV